MELDAVKKVITDQLEEIDIILGDEKLIERDMADPSKYMQGPNILAILGVRRCGKSTYALSLARELGPFGYVNLDDERLFGMPSSELGSLIEAWIEVLGEEPDIIVLDEIQNVEGWELFVNRMRRTKRVIITGSNAHLLEGDLSTHLTGRYIDLKMYPFSFMEYLRFKHVEVNIDRIEGSSLSSRIRTHLEDYIDSGGFPEAHVLGGTILARIYKDIILKDAILRYGIRNRKTFNEVARYLISNYSREFTFSRVARICGMSNKNQASEYSGILEEVGIFFYLERYSPKLSEQYNSPKKSYCIDTGLIRSIGFNVSENRGLLMENLVAVELVRRISDRDDGSELYYWNDHSRGEVDFLVRKDGTITELVQVTYSLKDESTRKREINVLFKASKELGCDELKIITWNEEGVIDRDHRSIHLVPLYKWLLL